MLEIPHVGDQVLQDPTESLREQTLALRARIEGIIAKEAERLEQTGSAGSSTYMFTKEVVEDSSGVPGTVIVFKHRYEGGPTTSLNRHLDTYKFMPNGELLSDYYVESAEGGITEGSRNLTNPYILDRSLWSIDGIIGKWDGKETRPGRYIPTPGIVVEASATPLRDQGERRKFGGNVVERFLGNFWRR